MLCTLTAEEEQKEREATELALDAEDEAEEKAARESSPTSSRSKNGEDWF